MAELDLEALEELMKVRMSEFENDNIQQEEKVAKGVLPLNGQPGEEAQISSERRKEEKRRGEGERRKSRSRSRSHKKKK